MSQSLEFIHACNEAPIEVETPFDPGKPYKHLASPQPPTGKCSCLLSTAPGCSECTSSSQFLFWHVSTENWLKREQKFISPCWCRDSLLEGHMMLDSHWDRAMEYPSLPWQNESRYCRVSYNWCILLMLCSVLLWLCRTMSDCPNCQPRITRATTCAVGALKWPTWLSTRVFLCTDDDFTFLAGWRVYVQGSLQVLYEAVDIP